jgi:histidinol-phosphatase (PHP family)
MTEQSAARYRAELERLKAEYGGKIELLMGIEQDYLSETPTDEYDFVIGSLHLMARGGEVLEVDWHVGRLEEIVTRHYGGDALAVAEDYYSRLPDMARKIKPTVVGHFDLINKFNEGGQLFDTANLRYRRAATDALAAMLERCRVLEVNTGAMYRNGRSEPYPQPWLLRELCARGGEVILSSDSHDTASLCHKFSEMEELLRSVGFKRRLTLTKNGFSEVSL